MVCETPGVHIVRLSMAWSRGGGAGFLSDTISLHCLLTADRGQCTHNNDVVIVVTSPVAKIIRHRRPLTSPDFLLGRTDKCHLGLHSHTYRGRHRVCS